MRMFRIIIRNGRIFKSPYLHIYNPISYKRLSPAGIGLDEQIDKKLRAPDNDINRALRDLFLQAISGHVNINLLRGICLQVRKFGGLTEMMDLRVFAAEYKRGGVSVQYFARLGLFCWSAIPVYEKIRRVSTGTGTSC